MMRPTPRLPFLASLAATLLLAVAPRAFAVEVQPLSFPHSPAWYFVSLQVEPGNPDPLAVFPIGGGFAYDHLWSYDPIDGWRHFGPDLDPGAARVFNDLGRIEALRGYWIHVTSVAPGGSELGVVGEPPTVQELDASGWHAAGPLVAPSAAPQPIDTVFADLGPALPDRLAAVWRYQQASNSFAELTDFGASCSATPEECLAPGEGYWLLTTGDVRIGRELLASSQCLVITPEDPVGRLDVSYRGVGPLAGLLEVETSGSGLVFFGVDPLTIEGVEVPVPDLRAPGGDGPHASCPDQCAGREDCANLCFDNPIGAHTVGVGLSLEALGGITRFSTCDDPHAEILLRASSDGGAGAGVLPEVVTRVKVAVRPPELTGSYAGRLYYGDADPAAVPFGFLLTECLPEGGGESCASGRVAAIVNPTVVGSTSNGLDDDDDGQIDEADEDGPGGTGKEIPRLETPGFPNDMRLFGSVSPDASYIELRGVDDRASDLDFARVDCEAGQCTDGSGACTTPADCGAATGLAGLFTSASRELALAGERVGPRVYAGTFSDGYGNVDLSGARVSATGRFVVSQVQAPQCVVRDLAQSRTIPLGVGCSDDSDCPGRCVGDPGIEGFSCSSDADCALQLEDGTPVAGSCQRYPCAFRRLSDDTLASIAHAPAASVDLNFIGSDRPIVVELRGPATFIGLASQDVNATFENLPCGNYGIYLTAPGCELIGGGIDPCVDPTAELSFLCLGAPANVPDGCPGLHCPRLFGDLFGVVQVELTGGLHRAAGNPVLAGSASGLDLTLQGGIAGQAVVGGVSAIGRTDRLEAAGVTRLYTGIGPALEPESE